MFKRYLDNEITGKLESYKKEASAIVKALIEANVLEKNMVKSSGLDIFLIFF